ncbi:MAG: TIGR02449 family protein [Gammaproteobacteria bacterium]|nr:TIGR02449 family protein [Gammaproteobacteria bacterium]
MNSDERQPDTELDLNNLENRVDELIRTVRRLREENSSLRSSQERLTLERAELIEKTELAKNRVESMITRLKSMETNL